MSWMLLEAHFPSPSTPLKSAIYFLFSNVSFKTCRNLIHCLCLLYLLLEPLNHVYGIVLHISVFPPFPARLITGEWTPVTYLAKQETLYPFSDTVQPA